VSPNRTRRSCRRALDTPAYFSQKCAPGTRATATQRSATISRVTTTVAHARRSSVLAKALLVGSACLSACTLFISLDGYSNGVDAGGSVLDAVADTPADSSSAPDAVPDATANDSAAADAAADADAGLRCPLEDLLSGKGEGAALYTKWGISAPATLAVVADAGADGGDAVRAKVQAGQNAY
jgi:hypothetical protein